MAKIEIDNKKMWESLIQLMSGGDSFMAVEDVTLALKAQGLTVNDKGEITTIEPEFKIEKGKWYRCIKDLNPINGSYIGLMPIMLDKIFEEGCLYHSLEDNYIRSTNGLSYSYDEIKNHFRPANEEETPQESKPEPKKCLFAKDLYTDEERKELCKDCQEECELNKGIESKERKVSGVLKNMLDNINEESLAKTREEMQKTPEIAEFDKAIETLIGNIDGDYCVHISSYDDYINKFAPKILAAARKLIVSEIDVDAMMSEYKLKEISPGLPTWIEDVILNRYRQGIEATIKKIKGESV